MTDTTYHLAQVNIGRMVAPIDSETMSGFVNRLDEINALADGYAGFVWRLQTDEGNATDLRPFDDDMMIMNMSVWESIEVLFDYTYRSKHLELLKSRWDWFEHMKAHHMCLWWIPAGTIPTPDDAKHRLTYMSEHGITPYAFTFKQQYSVEDMLAHTNVDC